MKDFAARKALKKRNKSSFWAVLQALLKEWRIGAISVSLYGIPVSVIFEPFRSSFRLPLFPKTKNSTHPWLWVFWLARLVSNCRHSKIHAEVKCMTHPFEPHSPFSPSPPPPPVSIGLLLISGDFFSAWALHIIFKKLISATNQSCFPLFCCHRSTAASSVKNAVVRSRFSSCSPPDCRQTRLRIDVPVAAVLCWRRMAFAFFTAHSWERSTVTTMTSASTTYPGQSE